MDAQDEDGDLPVTHEALPAYLVPTSWCEATVDLTVFGLGKVYLVDATDAAHKEWASVGPKSGWDSVLSTAKLFCAYVDHADDPSFPVKGSGWQKWDAWLKGGVRAKVVRRLSDSIIKFMKYVGDDAAVPN